MKSETKVTVEETPAAVTPVADRRVADHIAPRRPLMAALIFKKNGALDLGWVLIALVTIVGLGTFVGQALGMIAVERPSKESWAWMGGFTLIAAIAGVARDRAELLKTVSGGGAIGVVSETVSRLRRPQEGSVVADPKVAETSPEPDLFTDDERGD